MPTLKTPSMIMHHHSEQSGLTGEERYFLYGDQGWQWLLRHSWGHLGVRAPRSPAPPSGSSSDGTPSSPAILSVEAIPHQAKHENTDQWLDSGSSCLFPSLHHMPRKPLLEKAEPQAHTPSPTPLHPQGTMFTQAGGRNIRWGEGTAPKPPPGWKHTKTGYQDRPRDNATQDQSRHGRDKWETRGHRKLCGNFPQIRPSAPVSHVP